MPALPATAHDLLFSCLSPKDLYRYSRGNRQAYADVSSFRRRAFSIYTLLSPYFTENETDQFRIIQAETGTLISGSTALQFFNRLAYPDSDLDIYVDHRYCVEVGRFLSGIGYEFIAGEKQNRNFYTAVEDVSERIAEQGDEEEFDPDDYGDGYSHLRGFAGVFNFERTRKEGGGDQKSKIQLITARHSPMHVILHFHSTCVMNVISHSHAYSLYPHATFEDSTSLICYTTEGRDRNFSRQKYIARGWTMISGLGYPVHFHIVENPNPVPGLPNATIYQSTTLRSSNGSAVSEGTSQPEKYSLDLFYADQVRYVGDKRCWTIALPPIPGSLSAQSSASACSSITSIVGNDFYALETIYNSRILEGNSWMVATSHSQSPYHNRGTHFFGQHTSNTMKWQPDASMVFSRPSGFGDLSLHFRYCLAPQVWSWLQTSGVNAELRSSGDFKYDVQLSNMLQAYCVVHNKNVEVEAEMQVLQDSLVDQGQSLNLNDSESG